MNFSELTDNRSVSIHYQCGIKIDTRLRTFVNRHNDRQLPIRRDFLHHFYGCIRKRVGQIVVFDIDGLGEIPAGIKLLKANNLGTRIGSLMDHRSRFINVLFDILPA